MGNNLSLYVHWPFCLSKCPYCDFNSHVAEGTVDHIKWLDALRAELEYFAGETENRALTSIFFGGGTPSLMRADTVAVIISDAKRYWPPANEADGVEITAEANPTSAGARKLSEFRAAGVNRLSLGVQSFDDNALKFLGREHSADDAKKAVTIAKGLFPACSMDLIYALPGQTAEAWRAELEHAFQFNPAHLSLYQLSVEPGTPFHKRNIKMAGEGAGAALFELTAELTAAAGLPAYEISNHARPGKECRHNLDIWQGGDYVGIGPGAHGRITGADGGLAGGADNMTDALYQIHDPARWLAAVAEKGHGVAKRNTLGARERLEELVMTGIRTARGIGPGLTQHLDGEMLAELIQGGFLGWKSGRLRATASGRLALNAVLAKLLAD